MSIMKRDNKINVLHKNALFDNEIRGTHQGPPVISFAGVRSYNIYNFFVLAVTALMGLISRRVSNC